MRNTPIIALRSFCVGIAAVVLAAFVSPPVYLFYLSKDVSTSGGGEVGWDLLTIYHNAWLRLWLIALLIFAVGFLFGFRYFSKHLAGK
jgi:hypothetical protein